MTGPIVVINPNSNVAVTEGVSQALERFRHPGGPEIECLTLAEGPLGIETDADCDAVVPPLVDRVKSRPDASAVVIACYSDPGLSPCREAASVPVFGIHECGVLTALAQADRFGVIALSDGSIARHRRALGRMGVLSRLAAERPLGMSVAETESGADVFDRLVDAGRALLTDDAGSVVLGCTGMSRHRAPLAAALGVPVIDPTQAAVAIALGAVATAR